MFPGTLSLGAQNTLALLGKQDFLKQAYLAGGSSLALQIGHRRSIDFDFFSYKKFETKQVKENLRLVGKYNVQNETPTTVVGEFNKIKFSLFYYPYKLVSKTKMYMGINLSGIEDIAAMKLAAITDRGIKKDYIDLFFLAKKYFPFENMFNFYDKKYKIFESNKLTLLKALQYFEDANGSDMPEMVKKIDWEEVKDFFRKETIRLAEKYI